MSKKRKKNLRFDWSLFSAAAFSVFGSCEESEPWNPKTLADLSQEALNFYEKAIAVEFEQEAESPVYLTSEPAGIGVTYKAVSFYGKLASKIAIGIILHNRRIVSYEKDDSSSMLWLKIFLLSYLEFQLFHDSLNGIYDLVKNSWPSMDKPIRFLGIAGSSGLEIAYRFTDKFSVLTNFGILGLYGRHQIMPDYYPEISLAPMDSRLIQWGNKAKKLLKEEMPLIHTLPLRRIEQERGVLKSQIDIEYKQIISELNVKFGKKQFKELPNTRSRRKLRREADIATILEEQPDITIDELAKKLGVSKSTISRSKVWRQHKAKPLKERYPDSVSSTEYE